MNYYWRQTIVGLLHHAAAKVPVMEASAEDLANELNLNLTSPKLEEAFALFQDAAARTRDPVFVTGAFYTMQALKEVERWEDQAEGPAGMIAGGRSYRETSGRPTPEPPSSAPPSLQYPSTAIPPADSDQAGREAEIGLLDLFDRIRAGASLEEALDLFPLIGEETSPDE